MKIVARTSRLSSPFLLILAGVYFALVCLSASCELLHAQTTNPRSHHTHEGQQPDKASTALLCAWACQVTESSTLTTHLWGGESLTPAVTTPVSDVVIASHPQFAQFPPRGPPL